MDVEKNTRISALSWLFVSVLVVLCATLGALQYGWIGDVAQAEHERLRAGLQLSLQRLSQEFNAEIGAACSELFQAASASTEKEREKEYAIQYARWRASSRHHGLFRRIVIVIPEEDSLRLRSLDLDKGTFGPAEWPPACSALK